MARMGAGKRSGNSLLKNPEAGKTSVLFRKKKASSPGSKSRPVGAAIPMHLAMKHPALSTLYLHSLLDSDLKR